MALSFHSGILFRSGTDDGPEQLALVRLGKILDAVHVARGDAEHVTGRQEEALGRLGQELRVVLVGVGQGELQLLGLAACHDEDHAAQANVVGMDAGGRQVELTGNIAGEDFDARVFEGPGGTGDDRAAEIGLG